MTPPKETNKTPITDHREMQIYELSDKEFRIIFLKKFIDLQDHVDQTIGVYLGGKIPPMGAKTFISTEPKDIGQEAIFSLMVRQR